MKRHDPATVRQQIANLRLLHPELVEDEDAWLISLESETDLTPLLRMIERKRQEAAALGGAIDSNVTELKLRQGRFERRELAMRELAFKLMQAAEVRKLELPEATLSIVNGPQKVVIVDEASLPEDVWRIRREPNKMLIKALLTAGEPCNGAALSNIEPHLVVRVR